MKEQICPYCGQKPPYHNEICIFSESRSDKRFSGPEFWQWYENQPLHRVLSYSGKISALRKLCKLGLLVRMGNRLHQKMGGNLSEAVFVLKTYSSMYSIQNSVSKKNDDFEKSELSDIKIEDMDLSKRAINALQNVGFEKFSDLERTDVKTLSQIHGIGYKTNHEICNLYEHLTGRVMRGWFQFYE